MACEIFKIEDSVVHARIRDVMRIDDQKKLESAGLELIGKGKTPLSRRYWLPDQLRLRKDGFPSPTGRRGPC